MEDLLSTVELRDSARKMLARARAQNLSASELWSAMVGAGWLGLSVPGELGGLEQPFSALAILYQESGRVLAPHGFVATTICLTGLASYSGRGQVARNLIEQTLAGTAVPMFTGSPAGDVEAPNGRLNGTLRNVLDVDTASHILVPFNRRGPAVAVIALPHPGVSLNFRATWDMTRRLFDVVIDDVEPRPEAILFERDAAESVMAVMAAQFELAVACDAVGGAEAIFAETLEYMLARRQFDRPIASFQALKHRCADLRTQMEAAGVLVTEGCRAFSQLQGDWGVTAGCARLYASEVYRKVTEEAIQFHGGMGFTWAHRCHQFLKRARLNDVLGGTPEQRKDAVAPALFRAAARPAPPSSKA